MTRLSTQLSHEHGPWTGLQKDQIRTLALSQRKASSRCSCSVLDKKLHCRLLTASLALHGFSDPKRRGNILRYEAISYAWGNKDDVVPVCCNGCEVAIPHSLHDALQQLWCKWPSLILWADALCIDQRNVEEKSHQVQMMGYIFENARVVHVWLGTDTKPIKKTWNTLIRISAPQAEQDGSRLLPAPARQALTELVSSARNLRRRISSLKEHRQEDDGDRYEDFRIALLDLAQRAWFTRAWTLQEILLASDAMVHCGELYMDRTAWNYSTSKLAGAFDLNREQRKVIGPGKLRLPTKPSQNMSLSALLIDSWARNATDVRDKVFSVLNLTQAQTLHSQHLVADYSLSARDVFIKAARACIIQDGNLLILGAAGVTRKLEPIQNHGSEEEGGKTGDESPGDSGIRTLPSWVPDWRPSSEKRVTVQAATLFAKRDISFTPLPDSQVLLPCSHHKSNQHTDTCGKIVVKGQAVGRLAAGKHRSEIILKSFPSCSFWAYSESGNLPFPYSVRLSHRKEITRIKSFIQSTLKHDAGDCPSDKGLNPDSHATICALRRDLLPCARPEDWLCKMDYARDFYILRPRCQSGTKSRNVPIADGSCSLICQIPARLGDERKMFESPHHLYSNAVIEKNIRLLPARRLDHLLWSYGRESNAMSQEMNPVLEQRADRMRPIEFEFTIR